MNKHNFVTSINRKLIEVYFLINFFVASINRTLIGFFFKSVLCCINKSNIDWGCFFFWIKFSITTINKTLFMFFYLINFFFATINKTLTNILNMEGFNPTMATNLQGMILSFKKCGQNNDFSYVAHLLDKFWAMIVFKLLINLWKFQKVYTKWLGTMLNVVNLDWMYKLFGSY